MRFSSVALALAGLLAAGIPAAYGQSTARIFNVAFGTPVTELPADQWVDPACGTNGGPRSILLDGFEDFARCRPEAGTGLHEVWFIYDDEWEYIARAYRDPGEIGRFSANKFYGQPIVTSLLIDDGGLVRGYRVVTDPRAPDDVRLEASSLMIYYKPLFAGAPWQCATLPREPLEEPVDDVFIKEDCVMVTADRYVRIESRRLRKPGQAVYDIPPEGYFESSTRLEVYDLAAVRDAPCCSASVPR